ncbi:PREDICTED: uncharacterized protein LOC106808518 isoform X2 [Priapulus caudatus]|uniref:Uncharacterized protein LOC106808518 isoform X2 n=1 Tax=Priapulus caudatus TaxID=37621 RepID=A0ABM1E3I8_PRICU|nr:PREDICTED: uncharacterized protein LOC106808518 isoform X2 [Priapulus caudatus]
MEHQRSPQSMTTISIKGSQVRPTGGNHEGTRKQTIAMAPGMKLVEDVVQQQQKQMLCKVAVIYRRAKRFAEGSSSAVRERNLNSLRSSFYSAAKKANIKINVFQDAKTIPLHPMTISTRLMFNDLLVARSEPFISAIDAETRAYQLAEKILMASLEKDVNTRIKVAVQDKVYFIIDKDLNDQSPILQMAAALQREDKLPCSPRHAIDRAGSDIATSINVKIMSNNHVTGTLFTARLSVDDVVLLASKKPWPTSQQAERHVYEQSYKTLLSLSPETFMLNRVNGEYQVVHLNSHPSDEQFSDYDGQQMAPADNVHIVVKSDPADCAKPRPDFHRLVNRSSLTRMSPTLTVADTGASSSKKCITVRSQDRVKAACKKSDGHGSKRDADESVTHQPTIAVVGRLHWCADALPREHNQPVPRKIICQDSIPEQARSRQMSHARISAPVSSVSSPHVVPTVTIIKSQGRLKQQSDEIATQRISESVVEFSSKDSETLSSATDPVHYAGFIPVCRTQKIDMEVKESPRVIPLQKQQRELAGKTSSEEVESSAFPSCSIVARSNVTTHVGDETANIHIGIAGNQDWENITQFREEVDPSGEEMIETEQNYSVIPDAGRNIDTSDAWQRYSYYEDDAFNENLASNPCDTWQGLPSSEDERDEPEFVRGQWERWTSVQSHGMACNLAATSSANDVSPTAICMEVTGHKGTGPGMAGEECRAPHSSAVPNVPNHVLPHIDLSGREHQRSPTQATLHGKFTSESFENKEGIQQNSNGRSNVDQVSSKVAQDSRSMTLFADRANPSVAEGASPGNLVTEQVHMDDASELALDKKWLQHLAQALIKSSTDIAARDIPGLFTATVKSMNLDISFVSDVKDMLGKECVMMHVLLSGILIASSQLVPWLEFQPECKTSEQLRRELRQELFGRAFTKLLQLQDSQYMLEIMRSKTGVKMMAVTRNKMKPTKQEIVAGSSNRVSQTMKGLSKQSGEKVIFRGTHHTDIQKKAFTAGHTNRMVKDHGNKSRVRNLRGTGHQWSVGQRRFPGPGHTQNRHSVQSLPVSASSLPSLMDVPVRPVIPTDQDCVIMQRPNFPVRQMDVDGLLKPPVGFLATPSHTETNTSSGLLRSPPDFEHGALKSALPCVDSSNPNTTSLPSHTSSVNQYQAVSADRQGILSNSPLQSNHGRKSRDGRHSDHRYPLDDGVEELPNAIPPAGVELEDWSGHFVSGNTDVPRMQQNDRDASPSTPTNRPLNHCSGDDMETDCGGRVTRLGQRDTGSRWSDSKLNTLKSCQSYTNDCDTTRNEARSGETVPNAKSPDKGWNRSRSGRGSKRHDRAWHNPRSAPGTADNREPGRTWHEPRSSRCATGDRGLDKSWDEGKTNECDTSDRGHAISWHGPSIDKSRTDGGWPDRPWNEHSSWHEPKSNKNSGLNDRGRERPWHEPRSREGKSDHRGSDSRWNEPKFDQRDTSDSWPDRPWHEPRSPEGNSNGRGYDNAWNEPKFDQSGADGIWLDEPWHEPRSREGNTDDRGSDSTWNEAKIENIGTHDRWQSETSSHNRRVEHHEPKSSQNNTSDRWSDKSWHQQKSVQGDMNTKCHVKEDRLKKWTGRIDSTQKPELIDLDDRFTGREESVQHSVQEYKDDGCTGVIDYMHRPVGWYT